MKPEKPVWVFVSSGPSATGKGLTVLIRNPNTGAEKSVSFSKYQELKRAGLLAARLELK